MVVEGERRYRMQLGRWEWVSLPVEQGAGFRSEESGAGSQSGEQGRDRHGARLGCQRRRQRRRRGLGRQSKPLWVLVSFEYKQARLVALLTGLVGSATLGG